jgi:hypothetical protein
MMEHSMLRNLAQQATDTLIRAQLLMFHALSDQISLTANARRHILDLDERMGMAWADFLVDGALPAEPPLPEMLRRLSEAAFNLSVVAEQQAPPGSGRRSNRSRHTTAIS